MHRRKHIAHTHSVCSSQCGTGGLPHLVTQPTYNRKAGFEKHANLDIEAPTRCENRDGFSDTRRPLYTLIPVNIVLPWTKGSSIGFSTRLTWQEDTGDRCGSSPCATRNTSEHIRKTEIEPMPRCPRPTLTDGAREGWPGFISDCPKQYDEDISISDSTPSDRGKYTPNEQARARTTNSGSPAHRIWVL